MLFIVTKTYLRGSKMIYIFLSISVIAYIWGVACFYKLACKTNNEEIAYMALIPILNIYLLVKIADFSAIYLLLFFIPIVNIIFYVFIFMRISAFIYKSAWLGILMIVPLLNFLVLTYLAFSPKHERLVL